jgi:hypothetical protein
MKKHVAAPIFGDDAAYLNPCAANGSGRRTRSSRVPRRRGVRGKPVALDRVRVKFCVDNFSYIIRFFRVRMQKL